MMDKLKSLWAKLNTDVSELWANNKWFVIVFGLIILVLKFRVFLIDFIATDAKVIFQETTKASDALDADEKKQEEAAQALIDAATKTTDGDVTDDWNQKK